MHTYTHAHTQRRERTLNSPRPSCIHVLRANSIRPACMRHNANHSHTARKLKFMDLCSCQQDKHFFHTAVACMSACAALACLSIGRAAHRPGIACAPAGTPRWLQHGTSSAHTRQAGSHSHSTATATASEVPVPGPVPVPGRLPYPGEQNFPRAERQVGGGADVLVVMRLRL